MNAGSPRGVESEKPPRRSLVSGRCELRTVAPRNENRERESLNHECIYLSALEQRLQRGTELVRRTCAIGVVGRSGLVERLGNDGA